MDARSIVEARGGTWHGSYGSAMCPAHDDRKPSLSVSDGEKQAIIVKCHAGCDSKDVITALSKLGLWPESTFKAPTLTVPNGNGHTTDDDDEDPLEAYLKQAAPPAQKAGIAATYTYRDENNKDVFETVRYIPKDFKQRHRGARNEWIWDLKGVQRVLYRLPELIAADPLAWVFIPAGEKDVDRLRDLGLVATTNPLGEGEGKWLPDYNHWLKDRTCVILQDNDATGAKHAEEVRDSLRGVAAAVWTLLLPNLPEHGDVSDWLDAGGTPDELYSLARAADPAFPVSVLPEAFRLYVEHVARLKVCPPEYVAIPLLVAAGAMLGNVVQLVLNSSWAERAQLFAGIIGPPGAKKSPAITSALAPVRGIQQQLGDVYAKKLRQYKEEKARWDSIPKKDREGRDPPEHPTYQHVMTNDVTIEKLAEILSKSKGILLSHDELAAWVLSMDQYRGGKGADRQHFLSMWTGTSFKVDRKANPEPIYVKHPCLGIIGGIQPEMLSSLVDKHGRSDGFLDRILWAYPDPIPGRWVDDDEQDVSGIDGVFSKLYDCYGTTDIAGNRVPLNLKFSAEAKSVWRDWYNETEDDINLQRIEPSLEGPWAKMPSQCARIALILHMIDGDETSTIAADTLRRAIRLTEFFKTNARKVYASLAEVAGKDDGLKIMEFIKEHGEVSQSEILRKVFSGPKRDAHVLNALLADMELRGLIACRQEETSGRARKVWSLS